MNCVAPVFSYFFLLVGWFCIKFVDNFTNGRLSRMLELLLRSLSIQIVKWDAYFIFSSKIVRSSSADNIVRFLIILIIIQIQCCTYLKNYLIFRFTICQDRGKAAQFQFPYSQLSVQNNRLVVRISCSSLFLLSSLE